MRKTALALTLVLMLSVNPFYDLTIHSAKAESTSTIYLRADGTIEGTDKIQRNENVYTFTNSIVGSIVIQKDSIIIDGARFTL